MRKIFRPKTIKKSKDMAAFICFVIILLYPIGKTHASSFNTSDTGEYNSEQNRAYPQVKLRNSEMRRLKSRNTEWEYEIDVSFPVGYDSENGRYPVVYVLDAEYNFGCTSYIARRLIKNKDIPKILVVGIAYDTDYENFYRKRMQDSTPESHIHGLNTGGVEPFLAFLKDELIPFIDTEYRTLKGDRTIVGHSITAFFCCYTLFNQPNLFQRYIIVSPSLWFSNGVLFDMEQKYAEKHKELKAAVYFSTGLDESDRMVSTSEKFIRIIKSRSYAGLKFNGAMAAGEHHRSLFPLAFTRGLQFVFSHQ
ncbi:MAG: alpha/beta hydrolase [Candidatus Aminicenantes bacterium]|nr:alpha/beta hydrolase [Candidatus Aminicenantes bacterium]